MKREKNAKNDFTLIKIKKNEKGRGYHEIIQKKNTQN